jgi:hypothetical protein
MDAPDDVTLLARWRGGDREAGEAGLQGPNDSGLGLL